MTIQEAIIQLESFLKYWRPFSNGKPDKEAFELLLAYSKESLKSSHKPVPLSSCKGCKYLGKWRENYHAFDATKVAECKRYPPTSNQDTEYGFYPLVFIDEGSCGEKIYI
jgi:hypothetical protein